MPRGAWPFVLSTRVIKSSECVGHVECMENLRYARSLVGRGCHAGHKHKWKGSLKSEKLFLNTLYFGKKYLRIWWGGG